MRTENDWIQTYTGRRFHPLDPDASQICLPDIAHALTLQCRFTGHCRHHYSIAEHSLVVAILVPECCRLQALLHDASEAYLADLPRPLKHLPEFVFYRDAETRLQRLVYSHFGCAEDTGSVVLTADTAALGLEAYWLMDARWTEPAWVYALRAAQERFGPLHTSRIGMSLGTTDLETIESQFLDAVHDCQRKRRVA